MHSKKLECTQTLEHPKERITSLCYKTPNLFTGTNSGIIRQWREHEGRFTLTHQFDTLQCTVTKIYAIGLVLVTAEIDRTVKIWKLSKRLPIHWKLKKTIPLEASEKNVCLATEIHLLRSYNLLLFNANVSRVNIQRFLGKKFSLLSKQYIPIPHSPKEDTIDVAVQLYYYSPQLGPAIGPH